MFFSSKGLSETAGILESNEQECFIKQSMLKNSRTHYYLCDKSKIGRVGYMRLSTFQNIQYLITDASVDGQLKATLDEFGVGVINI